ncbi:hypothetical protein IFM89_036370 [Coptis chinensis]|uniref:phosphoenolpyruvate carboxykinase (ATP) n=1 Tax=Coptis chinensis TaxID=261450 RepID=A0A835LPW3_9MAGN|nr:hypothetical protein IFM89_036370 [Coptis chinensis]
MSLLIRRLVQRAFNFPTTTPATSSAISFSRRYAVQAPVSEEEAKAVVSPRKGPRISNGLNWALAGKGVIVQDKSHYNLSSSELKHFGGTIAESLSGIPVHVRGDVTGRTPKISKAEYGKLLKHVTSHISSISDVFVHDGAVGSSLICDAKVRVISDSPSAVLSLSNVLWKTPTRAVSHDSCPLTVYVATSISPNFLESIGLASQVNSGLLAADIERSSLILCGKAFSNTKSIKDALAAVAEPVISARGGLLLSARLLVSGDSVVLLFATEDVIKSCSSTVLSADAGVILSSDGVSSLFQTGDSTTLTLFKLPSAVILASADSSGILPSASKLSPGQAAYHFLAGYQNGKFVPAYSNGPSALDPLELAKSFLSKLKDHQIPSFLVNVNKGDKKVTGKVEKRAFGNKLVKLIQSTLSMNIPPFNPKAGDFQSMYKNFVSSKHRELPEEFCF